MENRISMWVHTRTDRYMQTDAQFVLTVHSTRTMHALHAPPGRERWHGEIINAHTGHTVMQTEHHDLRWVQARCEEWVQGHRAEYEREHTHRS